MRIPSQSDSKLTATKAASRKVYPLVHHFGAAVGTPVFAANVGCSGLCVAMPKFQKLILPSWRLIVQLFDEFAHIRAFPEGRKVRCLVGAVDREFGSFDVRRLALRTQGTG